MIPPVQICVAPGAEVLLSCDPGGECLDHCSWDTPLGPCSWSDGSVHCSDPTVTPRLSGGNCNLQISSAEYRHEGLWKCKVFPSTVALSGGVQRETFLHDKENVLSDQVNLTISSNCPATGGLANNWWRTGWTAGLLWSGVGLLLLIIIIIVIILIYCLCPVLCCNRQSDKRQDHRYSAHHATHQVPPPHHYLVEVSGIEVLLYQETAGQYSEVRRDRRRQNNSQEPVVLEDERIQRSGYDRDIFETRNIPDYRTHSQGLRQQPQEETSR